MEASYSLQLESVRALLQAGADVNTSQGGQGRPPLHWACIEDRRDIVDLLLAAGADLQRRDRDGHTALEWVDGTVRNFPELAAYLESRGAR